MLRKLISLSLVAVMLSVTAFATVGMAATTFSYDRESIVTKITEADGTEHASNLIPWEGGIAESVATTTIEGKTYYQIANGDDLRWFAEFVNSNTQIAGADTADDTTDDVYSTGANAILVSDIDLNSKLFTSYQIGRSASYSGIFDGAGHTIYNFKSESATKFYIPMFHTVTGTIKDIKFVNATVVNSSTNSGNIGLSVLCYKLSNGTISGVSVSGKISTTYNATYQRYAREVGGIVANLAGGTVENCYCDATIDLKNSHPTSQDTFSNTPTKYYGVGGIVGYVSASTSNIKKCGFGGTIDAPYHSRVGGIAGNTASAVKILIEGCYNTGNITALRQVGGILGWFGYGGKDGYSAADIRQCYNTGNIIVKASEDSYAAGIASGFRGDMVVDAYTVGDVSVDKADALTFNSKCALGLTIYQATTTSTNYYKYIKSADIAYLERTYTNKESVEVAKHVAASTDETIIEAEDNKLKGFTETEFTDGTALTTLGTNYTSDIGINNGLPILAWQATAPITAADEYEISATKGLTLTLDKAGRVALDIKPLAGSATVTVGSDTKTITQAGTYYFKADSLTAAVSVNGRAIVNEDVTAQTTGAAIEELTADSIKATMDCDAASATVILALFDGTVLQKVAYFENVAALDGKLSAVIDLTGEDVADCTLRAFLWNNGTLVPIAAEVAELN